MKTVWAQFQAANQAPDGRSTYPFLSDEDIKIGKYVIVPSSKTYSVARVVEKPEDRINNIPIENMRYIVVVIDDAVYLERVRINTRSNEIMAELKQRAEKVEILQRYDEIAKRDPEALALMKELNELQKGA